MTKATWGTMLRPTCLLSIGVTVIVACLLAGSGCSTASSLDECTACMHADGSECTVGGSRHDLLVAACLDILRDCTVFEAALFDPTSLVRCVNRLRHYDKVAVCDAMELYLNRLGRDRRFVSRDTGTGQKVQLILLLLFPDGPDKNGFRYMQSHGEVLHEDVLAEVWPTYPLLVVDDVPFLFMSEPNEWGPVSFPFDAINRVRRDYRSSDMRRDPLVPVGDPKSWMSKLHEFTYYSDIRCRYETLAPGPEAFDRMLQVQCLRAMTPALPISEHILMERLYNNKLDQSEETWRSAVEMVEKGRFVWCVHTQEFSFPD